MLAYIGFSGNIYCNEAISWSNDNRVALSTNDGIKILTLNCCAKDVRPTVSFHQSFIPNQTEIWDIPKLDREQYTEILHKSFREEYSAVVVDRVMNPLSPKSFPITGYCGARWSPPGGDSIGRCIIAALSHDFRLCLYAQRDSLIDWFKICDLSELGRELVPPKMPSWKHYNNYRDWCYRQAAVGICWYPKAIVNGNQGSYGLLAVSMMSGHVIIWRVDMPCNDGSQCTLVTSIQPHDVYPTAIAWSPSGLLAIGYVDGQVFSVVVSEAVTATNIPSSTEDGTQPVAPTVKPVYSEADQLRVSCLCFTSCKKLEGDLLLINKEDCVCAYQLSASGDVLLSTHQFAENKLHGTGMCEGGDWVLMSSADGLVQKLEADGDPEGLRLSITKLDTSLEERYSWICSGVTMSPNGVFVAFSVRPSSSFDHVVERQPTKVHIRPLMKVAEDYRSQGQARVNSQLTDDTVPLKDMPDVLEVYRESFCQSDTGWLDADLLNKATLKSCQLQRITDMLSRTMDKEQPPATGITDTTDSVNKPIVTSISPDKSVAKLETNTVSESPDKSITTSEPANDISALSQSQNEAGELVSRRILCFYIQSAVETLTKTGPSTFNKKETDILQAMKSFVSSEHEPTSGEVNFTQTYESLSRVLENCSVPQPKCCICATAITLAGFQLGCNNGHTFGVCCKTLLPCDDMNYRTCIVCSAQALPSNTLKDISWLTDLHHCSLCGGLLL